MTHEGEDLCNSGQCCPKIGQMFAYPTVLGIIVRHCPLRPYADIVFLAWTLY